MLIGFCATTGSSLCFLLSKVYGKGLLKAMVDEAKLDEFREELGKKTTISDIAQFMLLTRVTPVPNVLVNLASPWMDVPLWVFSLTTFIGAFVARAFGTSPPRILFNVPLLPCAGQIPLNSVHVTTGRLVKQGGDALTKSLQDSTAKYYIFAAGMAATAIAYINWQQKQKKEAGKAGKK